MPGVAVPVRPRDDDKHHYASHLRHIPHAAQALVSHGESRIPVVPVTKFTVPEPAIRPPAYRSFTSGSAAKPLVSESSGLFRGKGFLAGIGGALAAGFGALFRRGKSSSE
jgi:hypothetical protein